ncbi:MULTISPECIES: HlyD family secretion protein [Methylomonas]|uniref:Secretion protein HlyD n=1 Tax=Methylomonas koyamae TaxID=702114 RepID=A0A177P9T5_9GAMM|nr:HlyD family efflux transporter periplasmic adaptor subunit [Methylomonas koyamae]OAI27015.1 secretion protein HlyD [Methylomonas koyamae]
MDEWHNRLSALAAAHTPRTVGRWARACVWVFVLTPPALLVTPWQQNIHASGRVSAFAPLERQQTVEAPVGGRIVAWHVKEGDKVKAGEVLLDIADVDPRLLERLAGQRDAAAAKLAAKQDELNAYRLQLDNLQATRDLQVATAQYRLDVAKQRARAAAEAIASARATLDAASLQRERLQRLLGDGLVSQREFELAERDGVVAGRGLNSAQASLEGALAEQRAAEAEIGRIRADAQARIDSASAAANKTQSELEDGRASLLKAEVDVSRQQSQSITAPRDGSVLRLLANPQSDLVRQGDPLLVLVPDRDVKAVELWVDGNDAALITPGRHARLQFEGWPALQFAGWPEVAVGTFGGSVAFVDASDDGKGKFRVLVIPDPADREWPSERFLRQGVRVKGWILLNRVTMAYELWRQLNAFPPQLTVEAPINDLVRQKLK